MPCLSRPSFQVVGRPRNYQKLEVLSFCHRERAETPSITVLTFLVKNEYNEVFWGVYLLRIHGKNFFQISSSFVNLNVSIIFLLNVIDSKTVCD